jgi:integrase
LGIKLYDREGQRLYLTPEERQAFLKAAKSFDAAERTYCETLAYTGCRPSEVRELTKDRFDFQAKRVMVESKKKRTDGIFRAIPVPPPYLDAMNLAHSLQLAQKSTKTRKQPLWTWQATKAYYVVKEVMAEAGIAGAHASAKGLRHGFAVNAAVNKVPLPLIKRWMGHSTLEMTAVYLEVMGEEEDVIAEQMW